jgi:inhibitor of cysteine peptidase
MKLYAIGLMVGLMLLLACSTHQKPALRKTFTIAISESDFRGSNAHPSKEVVLVAGDTLVIELGSNPTTGYRWLETLANSSPEVLEQAKHEYSRRGDKGPNGEPIIGAGGVETWTFKAVKTGKATLDFSYGRPWQGGEKAAWTLRVTVNVSNAQR